MAEKDISPERALPMCFVVVVWLVFGRGQSVVGKVADGAGMTWRTGGWGMRPSGSVNLPS